MINLQDFGGLIEHRRIKAPLNASQELHRRYERVNRASAASYMCSDGYTYREIAQWFGFSVSRARQLIVWFDRYIPADYLTEEVCKKGRRLR